MLYSLLLFNYKNDYKKQFYSTRKGSPRERVCHDIVEKWLRGTGVREIGRQMNIPKSTIGNIIDKFVERREDIAVLKLVGIATESKD